MASGQLQPVIRHLRQLVSRQEPDDWSDQALLERFAARHEEVVFETLLRRHGPLVLGVCRRALGHEQDAEDVFQATFLVLARKADSIRKQASLASWLHGVAYRLALKARAAAARRRTHERRCGAMSQAVFHPEPGWQELRPVLDEELQRLPLKHRAPLILCYLEGKTHAEAARALGWSLGSMSKRLARARELLRGRLERRGIALSAAALGALAAGQARAAVPPLLLQASLQAAVLAATGQVAGVASPAVLTLMAGGLRTMFYAKLCRVGVLILTGALVLGGMGVVAQQLTARTGAGISENSAIVADDEKQDKPGAALPFVPGDALGFLHVNVHDLWTSPALEGMRARNGRKLPAMLRELSGQLGVSLDDVQTVTILILDTETTKRPGPEAGELTAVTTVQPYAQDRVVQAVVGKAEEKEENGKKYFVQPNGNPGTALYPLNERTFLAGNRKVLEGYLAMEINSKGPLADALKLAGQKHAAVLAFQVPDEFAREFRSRSGHLPPTVQFLKPALEAKIGTAVVDADGQQIRLDARIRYADADTAQQAQDAIKVGINMLRQHLATGLPPEARRMRAIASLFKEMSQALRSADVTQHDKLVRIRLESNAAPVLASALPALEQTHKASARMQDSNNLKQMALAMHNYADTYTHFPPAAICSKGGKPLLSWRVAILPYIEQDNLYRQFHLDEPWDSEHNKKLLEIMPKIYMPVQGKAGPYQTFYRVFTGKQTVFPGGNRSSRIPDITDGTSNTIMIAESAKAVPWTKPDDMPYSSDKPLPKLGGEFDDGFNAAFADGSVHWIPKSIEQQTLRALITANGGETVDWSKVDRAAHSYER